MPFNRFEAPCIPLTLIHILKIWIFLVRHVSKCRRIQIIIIFQHPTLPQLRPPLLLLLVFPDESISEDKEQCQFDEVGDEQGANSQRILGSLFGLIEEWRDNITDAGAEPDHTGDDHLLGLATGVGRYEGEGEHERGLVGSGQIAEAC